MNTLQQEEETKVEQGKDRVTNRNEDGTSHQLIYEVCHPRCVCETRKRYVVKHNLIIEVYLMTM